MKVLRRFRGFRRRRELFFFVACVWLGDGFLWFVRVRAFFQVYIIDL